MGIDQRAKVYLLMYRNYITRNQELQDGQCGVQIIYYSLVSKLLPVFYP